METAKNFETVLGYTYYLLRLGLELVSCPKCQRHMTQRTGIKRRMCMTCSFSRMMQRGY